MGTGWREGRVGRSTQEWGFVKLEVCEGRIRRLFRVSDSRVGSKKLFIRQPGLPDEPWRQI